MVLSLRMKKTCKAKLILALSLLAGCAPGPSPGNDKLPGRYSAVTTEAGFDTVVTMQEWVSSEEEFTRHFSLVQEKLRHYNDLFDIYNNYEGLNNLRTINENAGIAPVETSPKSLRCCCRPVSSMNSPTGVSMSRWAPCCRSGTITVTGGLN